MVDDVIDVIGGEMYGKAGGLRDRLHGPTPENHRPLDQSIYCMSYTCPGCQVPDAISSAIAAAKPSTSSSVVSKAHIQRTSPVDSSQK